MERMFIGLRSLEPKETEAGNNETCSTCGNVADQMVTFQIRDARRLEKYCNRSLSYYRFIVINMALFLL